MTVVLAATRIPPAALIQLAAAVVLLGAGWPVTKIALLDGAPPSWFALGRAGLSAVVAFLAVATGPGIKAPRRIDIPALLAIGLLQLAGFFALAHAAIAWIPAGRTAILSNATIIWTVPITLLLTSETISRPRWIAATLGAAGVVVLAGPWAIDWSSKPTILGHAYLLGAALCWAASMTIVRRWPPRLSMFALLPWAFALATLALLPMALVHNQGQWTRNGLICLAAIGLVMGPIGTWCLVQATMSLPLIVASVGFLAGPAIGLLLSAIWLDEPLTVSLLLGAALLLAGAATATRSAAT